MKGNLDVDNVDVMYNRQFNKPTSESLDLDNINNLNEKKNDYPHYQIQGKKFIVTSALPYANGEIHLGHIASTYLPADVFTKFIKLTGNQIFHICATDDFGTPILIKAEREGKTPEDYVRIWNDKDKIAFESVGIDFDYFSSTSSKENIKFVQDVFLKLFKNNYIKEEKVVQFYCINDNKYLPDRYVIGVCPFCGAKDQYSDLCEVCGRVPEEILHPRCSLCGNPPIKKESNHYFFKLSDFTDQLKHWLENNRNLQYDVVKYVMNWINLGLQDWDITRDLTWGVPIPNLGKQQNMENKVFYGWFDNHLCYISTLETFALKELNQNGKSLWNDSEIYHFIGKDIIYHHYLFLPAIRIGINNEYKLPDNIITRGHLLFQNKKLSKSKNWYIGLEEFTKNFNPDYLRFYFSSIIPYSQSDINFDWDNFYEKINNELISNIGNLINRTLSFLCKHFDCKVPLPSEMNKIDEQAISEIKIIAYDVGELLYKNQVDKALKRILKFGSFFNQYFQSKTPWKLPSDINNTMWISVNAIRTVSILLYPFIPFSSQKIWKQLGYNDNVYEQNWYSASSLLIPTDHYIHNEITPVFRKVEKQEIEIQKKGL